MGISNILFILLLAGGIIFFTINVRKIIRNINLGKDIDRNDNKPLRWKTMARVALGQSKMVTRPLAGIMHIFVYVGFVIINIEVLEIIIDGIFGTHRVFSFLGSFYNFLIGLFEFLAIATMFGCIVFLIRRNIGRIKRFWSKEMTIWPRSDANIILITEILLMSAFLTMNGCDFLLQQSGHVAKAGAFPISSLIAILFSGMNPHSLEMLEKSCWWFHIIGIIAFLNYLPYSKHFHILLAFPNVYYSNLQPKGEFNNLEAVTNEVKLMFDPNAANAAPPAAPGRFGAKDVTDLTWKQLMDSYSCTECGRCTSSCPANQTGKLLSPRKIMMDTRKRLEEVGKNLDKNGVPQEDGKSLLGDYITPEELWACTSCNACVQECPVDIDPLSLIVEMRRFLVMEQSAAPSGLNLMFTNIENNGAPWQFPPTDRLNWVSEK
ncbi:MAG: (Fe-S)-binding protein [Bacteroidia bacterium]